MEDQLHSELAANFAQDNKSGTTIELHRWIVDEICGPSDTPSYNHATRLRFEALFAEHGDPDVIQRVYDAAEAGRRGLTVDEYLRGQAAHAARA